MFVTPGLFRFLKELRQHNDREWFNANKEHYLAQVRDPLLGFITALAPKLRAISPTSSSMRGPRGGSLLRIYRDTRFTADKKPYKTNAAVFFPLAAGKDVEAPGYYLHLEPAQVDRRLGAASSHLLPGLSLTSS